MRNCLLFLLALTALHCAPVKIPPALRGPLVLHAWIYYGREPAELRKVVDSSHLHYTMIQERESDGFTRVEFCFRPDPGLRQMEKLFKRLRRYPGIRGFATTRGIKEMQL